MRRVLPALLFTSFALTTSSLFAQRDHFAYAITDMSKEGSGWNVLRKLDLQSGTYSDVILNGTNAQLSVFDASTKKQLVQQPDAKWGNMMHAPFTTGVAAAAYDRKNNRLYFTPMFVDQLRYIDMKTMKVYYVADQPFTKLGNMHNDEGKIVTRMVIAPDGYGYAITNDGHTFIRFSTGRKSRIEHLGTLVDDQANGSISIHNRCTSFGGDMISDNKGNLFILSARNHVFKVNTNNKVATHVGNIQGLTPNFTVNGAVVDGDGNLLVSSAVDGNTYYVVNPLNWSASPYKTVNGIYRSSDLANSNFLSEPKKDPVIVASPVALPDVKKAPDMAAGVFNNQIAVYPNPVTSDIITIQFKKVPHGNYVLELNDVLGRSVSQKRITINNENQVQVIALDKTNAKGIYLIKVFDGKTESVFTQKVVVQ